MSKFIKRIVFLLLLTAITIILLIGIQPLLYKTLPSDFNRHLVIQDFFNEDDSTHNSDIILFGDSRSMFGVDTRILKEKLKVPGEVINLSSVGQNIYESSYYYSRIKSDTKVIIQCTGPSFFTENTKHNLPEGKAISMFLSGYRIDETTKHLIPSYNRFFDHSQLINYYESKSYFRTYVHNVLRPYLDNEKFDESSRTSRYFPHHYTQNKVPQYSKHVKYNCDGYRPKHDPKYQREFLKKSVAYFNNEKIKYILVLMPVNPDLCSESYEEYKAYAEDLSKINGISVIDLSQTLTSQFFYDATHANKAGAKIISNELSKQLKLLTKNQRI